MDEWKQKAKGASWLTKPIAAHAVVLGMAVWLLQVSASAAALGGFLIGSSLMVLCTMRWFYARRVLLHVLVVCVVTVCVFGVIVDTSVGLVQAAGKDSTLTDRTYLWHDLMEVDINPLFGTGFESFWLGTRVKLLWEKFAFRPNQAHNGYIETYLTLGWVGLVILGYQILWGYRNAVNALPGDGKLKLAVVVVTVILNLTEATFKVVHPVWVVFMLLIMAVPAAARQEQEYGIQQPATPPYRPARSNLSSIR
jgi:O-antigen ligase